MSKKEEEDTKKKEKKASSKKEKKTLEASLKEKIGELENFLKEADEKVKDNDDKLLRSLAEQENFKRRKEQEVLSFKKYAVDQIVTDLLPVLDSFDRACEQLDNLSDEAKKVLEGFVLIQKQFHSVLEKNNIVPIEAVGMPMDPNLHQAIMQEECEDVEAGSVIKEMQKGYKLHDRVLRPAMVVVAK
jgi:molecular chaperone GrpE